MMLSDFQNILICQKADIRVVVKVFLIFLYQAETIRLNAVHYDLENWKGITASKCALFTNIDTSYIPIGRIVRTGGIAACPHV